jgi:hypothetical protein
MTIALEVMVLNAIDFMLRVIIAASETLLLNSVHVIEAANKPPAAG